MKIFLGDLVHSWEKISVWTMPLNIGYVATFVRKHLGPDVDIRLFKRPDIMIDAIREESPDVVGLSYYVWNANLNHLVMQIAKQSRVDTLTIGGGPNITSINANEEGARRFFSCQPEVDLYCVNQGEKTFLEAINAFEAAGRNLRTLRRETVPGVMVNNLLQENSVQVGPSLDAIRDLDEIPSPYLEGLLDPFFDDHIIPIIETNRSCPYRCTFCAWGIGTQKLARFSEGRVLDEIDYISKRARLTANMYVADANFAILERDADFARRMRENHHKYGFPGHVMVQWNKTRPDRVLKVAEAFGSLSEVGASMQSLNPKVLSAIKRRNLPLDDIVGMQRSLKEKGIDMSLFSELIVGLPNETFASHIDANKKLINLGAEVFNYNLHLLPGTEMDTALSREQYFRRTGWRLHDNAFGIYDGKKVFEGQEVVLETNSMSVDELRSFRFIHFLIQFMWGRKWYYDYLMVFKRLDIHPVDMILRVAEAIKADGGEIGRLYQDFRSDHDLENFKSFDALVEYWRQDAPFERLREGSYGKLNYLYTYRIVLEHQEAFNRLLSAVTADVVGRLEVDEPDHILAQVDDVLRFSEHLRIHLTDKLSLVEVSRASFNFDILAWKTAGSQGALAQRADGARIEYEFFLPPQQRDILRRQLNQFDAGNINATLRKMSEDTSADQFFYKVREVNNPSYVR